MIVYSKKENSEYYREFLIPKEGDIKIGGSVLHVIIDDTNAKFLAKKLVVKNNLDEAQWEKFDDYTFPSSLLNKFLRTEHKLQSLKSDEHL